MRARRRFYLPSPPPPSCASVILHLSAPPADTPAPPPAAHPPPVAPAHAVGTSPTPAPLADSTAPAAPVVPIAAPEMAVRVANEVGGDISLALEAEGPGRPEEQGPGRGARARGQGPGRPEEQAVAQLRREIELEVRAEIELEVRAEYEARARAQPSLHAASGQAEPQQPAVRTADGAMGTADGEGEDADEDAHLSFATKLLVWEQLQQQLRTLRLRTIIKGRELPPKQLQVRRSQVESAVLAYFGSVPPDGLKTWASASAIKRMYQPIQAHVRACRRIAPLTFVPAPALSCALHPRSPVLSLAQCEGDACTCVLTHARTHTHTACA